MERRIREVLRHKGGTIHWVTSDTSVIDAVRVMNRHGIGAVLVKNGDVPVGIFTERDVLVRIVDAGRDPGRTLVDEVMTKSIVTISADRRVVDALRLMTERRVRHLPVIDSDRLIGLVSIGDLTKSLTRDLEEEVEQLEEYITGPHLRA